MNQFSNQFLLFLNLIYETYSHLSGEWFPCYSLPDMGVILISYLSLFDLYKVMIGYLYFLNNLKDINDHIKDYTISCKIFLQ